MTLALDAISNDLADGNADDADAFFDAADAYADFGVLLPAIDASLIPADAEFQSAASAMYALGQHVQCGSVGNDAVDFLDGLVAFKDTQLAIASSLFDLTEDFAPAGPGSATTHPVQGTVRLESTADILLAYSSWDAYAIGYQVGTTPNPNITVWVREETYLHTLSIKQVNAGFASDWNRFFGIDGVAFSTSVMTSTDPITVLASDPTVGTLP